VHETTQGSASPQSGFTLSRVTISCIDCFESDEQKIALRQRSKALKWLRVGEHSPSKQIIDDVLRDLSDEGIVEFESKHYIGVPIIYSNQDRILVSRIGTCQMGSQCQAEPFGHRL
jgi:hypothetical protein